MENAQRLPKIRDSEKESEYGYVYAVSGPGKWQYSTLNIEVYLGRYFTSHREDGEKSSNIVLNVHLDIFKNQISSKYR